MKRFLIFFNLCILSSLLGSTGSYAQSINQLVSDLKTKLGEVTIDKTTYTQNVEVLDETKGKIRYESVAVTEKGVSTKTAYELYLSDIDKNTLLRKPSGKKFFVSFFINNKQKFVKFYKDDKFESYADNVEILVLGADVAQEVIDLLKSAIPLSKNTEKTWTSSTEALNWLQANVKEVTDKTGTKQQVFKFDKTNPNLLELSVTSNDSKGTLEEKYSWNVTDLNRSKLNIKISGALLNINLETKDNDKLIKYTKGGELQNYASGLEIASDDVENARNIIAAFSTAIDKSKPKTLEFKTQQAAFEFLTANVGEAALDQKPRQQKIEFSKGSPVKCTFTADEADSKGKIVSNQYEFYLTDADPNVTFKVSGKKIVIPVQMIAKSKYVRYLKDNIPQNYVEDIEIYQSDIETARHVVAALIAAIKGSKDTPAKFTTVAEAMKFLQTNIEGASLGTEEYKLTFEGSTAEPYTCTYSTVKTDSKGVTTEESYLFYPYMLDVNTVKVEPDGKYLNVTSLLTGKKAYIKKIKKDQNSFVGELNIISFDVKKAKDIAAALKFLGANTTPKARVFTSKQAALDYIKQNVGEVTYGSKTIRQKVDLAEDNPCKVILTVNTDDKGKSTEQIFEFTLSDINKQVEYKPAGSNVSIVLTSKNKQKLIKPYKDGAQQSFTTDVEFLCSDIEVAKTLTDAFKYAAESCE